MQIVGAAEQQQVVVNFNDTAAAYPTGQAVHELFEARVEATMPSPSNSKINDSPTPNSTRANQLAHYLRSAAGPDVLVAVIIERSVEMAVGLLAILKALAVRMFRSIGVSGRAQTLHARRLGSAGAARNPRSSPLCPNMPHVFVSTLIGQISQERGDNPACHITDDNL